MDFRKILVSNRFKFELLNNLKLNYEKISRFIQSVFPCFRRHY